MHGLAENKGYRDNEACTNLLICKKHRGRMEISSHAPFAFYVVEDSLDLFSREADTRRNSGRAVATILSVKNEIHFVVRE